MDFMLMIVAFLCKIYFCCIVKVSLVQANVLIFREFCMKNNAHKNVTVYFFTGSDLGLYQNPILA